MPHFLVIGFELLIAAAVLVVPDRARVLAATAALGLVLALMSESPARPVGDSDEYIVMSMNLARLTPPAAAPEDLRRSASVVGSVSHLANERLTDASGRQVFPHFWFYSLLAAPFVRAAIAAGSNPITGFAILNFILLSGTMAVLVKRFPIAVPLLLMAGPVMWWADKAHTEVFTFSLLVLAITWLPHETWKSMVAFGAAATQNPPILGALLIAFGYAVSVFGWRDSRVWKGAALGAALALLHPVYFGTHLGTWTGLHDAIDVHQPSLRELTAPALDPNLGMFVHDPFFTISVLSALVMALRRPPMRLFNNGRGAIGLIAALFLLSFTQTTNFNSGGTPAPSRYGLWLLPFAVPVFAAVRPSGLGFRLLAVASMGWCVVHFAPALPDEYLKPTAIAASMWRDWPALDNPLAEVFGERVSGAEPSPRPPIATAGCGKVLLIGEGTDASWPSVCTPAHPPPFCIYAGALCYANRSGGSYTFTRAPSSPAWLREHLTPPPEPGSDEIPASEYVLPSMGSPSAVLWLDARWSYLEQAAEPAAGGRTVSWRWMGDEAAIGILAARGLSASLRLVAQSYGRPRRVRLSIGDAAITVLQVTPKRAAFDTPPFPLAEGATLVTVRCLDRTGISRDDPRPLSIALFHVEVVPRQ